MLFIIKKSLWFLLAESPLLPHLWLWLFLLSSYMPSFPWDSSRPFLPGQSHHPPSGLTAESWNGHICISSKPVSCDLPSQDPTPQTPLKYTYSNNPLTQSSSREDSRILCHMHKCSWELWEGSGVPCVPESKWEEATPELSPKEDEWGVRGGGEEMNSHFQNY